MTVYIMGKPQPPALSARLEQSVHAARHRQAMDRRIDARSYRRVMGMAEDLLLIAHAQAEVGGLHPDSAGAARWLASVAAQCRAKRDAAMEYERLAAGLGFPPGRAAA